ncbi:hypothetical protein EDC05_004372 [Coemansia umbellata]|nr:hypothetical protein EDC05_004372 [Coemansia umbellata]
MSTVSGLLKSMIETMLQILTAKIPLWQATLLLGSTALLTRLSFHTTAAAKKSKNKEEVPSEEIKLVLVIRTDLGMTKGKIAAQCAHATLGCYKRAIRQKPQVLKMWEATGQSKVTLKCASEEEMLELQQRARSLGLVSESICDAGRTQIAAGSRTVLGIGPGPASVVDQVSGHLKLY